LLGPRGGGGIYDDSLSVVLVSMMDVLARFWGDGTEGQKGGLEGKPSNFFNIFISNYYGF
jgi:hypothetical protein